MCMLRRSHPAAAVSMAPEQGLQDPRLPVHHQHVRQLVRSRAPDVLLSLRSARAVVASDQPPPLLQVWTSATSTTSASQACNDGLADSLAHAVQLQQWLQQDQQPRFRRRLQVALQDRLAGRVQDFLHTRHPAPQVVSTAVLLRACLPCRYDWQVLRLLHTLRMRVRDGIPAFETSRRQ